MQAKTVLAGVKTLALVLNRVLVACIAAVCNFFFLGHLGHMTSLIHHISHHFENRNNVKTAWQYYYDFQKGVKSMDQQRSGAQKKKFFARTQ